MLNDPGHMWHLWISIMTIPYLKIKIFLRMCKNRGEPFLNKPPHFTLRMTGHTGLIFSLHLFLWQYSQKQLVVFLVIHATCLKTNIMPRMLWENKTFFGLQGKYFITILSYPVGNSYNIEKCFFLPVIIFHHCFNLI